ncbi:unnamed protein product [Mytilus edulis]|uniref:AIG1-type G domain-containing protein n=1 Tax=Mytilus edulis TaxID=6550 RepID=A0A8S3T0C1_MYTED|nr:unnamed protein product [Mytilus edulis]
MLKATMAHIRLDWTNRHKNSSIMSTIIKKICKVCGELRIIEDNKCTHCQSEYDDEFVASIWSKLEQKKVLPGITKPKAGYFGVDRPKSVDGSLLRRNSDEENKSVMLKLYTILRNGDREKLQFGLRYNHTLNKQEDGNMRGRLEVNVMGYFRHCTSNHMRKQKDKRLRIVERMVVDTTVSDTLTWRYIALRPVSMPSLFDRTYSRFPPPKPPRKATQALFKSHICGKSVTKKCEKFDGICNGKRLVVIDTPGLFDTTLSHDAISGEIIRCAHLSLPGPHVFLIVLQITRFTNEETVALEQLFDIFGTSMGKYSLIVFTRSEELEREGKSIKSFIEEAGSPLTDFIRKCKSRYIAINNTATGSSKAEMVTKLVMAISEIVKDNNGDHFTNQIIDEANREALVLQVLQKSFVIQDNDEEKDFDEEEQDTISLDSHDSGVSMPNQPIYDEAYGEYDMKETELNKLIDKTDREIRNNEAIKSNLQELNEKDVKNIDFQLTKKRKEVIDIKADLNSMLNLCRMLEQQKGEIENKTKIGIEERDLQLKQLHKRKIKLAKQKCNHERQQMKLRQNLSKESDSLQTKLNTPQNGCLIM